jgi:hypothetical protein
MPETMQLPILGTGIAGRARAVSAQKRQNLFLEVKAEKDKTSLAAYGTPGLKYFSSLGASPIRGLWWYQATNRLFAVAYDQLVEISPDGTTVNRGTLMSTSGTVSMADNGLQLMIVDGLSGYIYQPTTGDLPYSKVGTTITITETLTTRKTGQVISVIGDNLTVFSADYTVQLIETVATALVTGTEYVIQSVGTSDFTLVGAAANEVGVVFTATGTTPGTGICTNANQFTITSGFVSTGTGTIKIINNFRTIASAYTGTNFPKATTVTFLDSYFVVNVVGTKQFWLSGSYDGFYWDPLQFASKESYTDNLQAVTVDNGQLLLLGPASYEYWQNTGGFPFPLQRISGSPYDVGLVAVRSIARSAGQTFFLGRARRGGISVIRLQDYRATPVSTPDLDYLFNGYESPEDAIAYSFRFTGHEFYVISFQAQKVTWMYDSTSDVWSALTSGADTRHYSKYATQFQNEIFVSDYRNGNLYTYDTAVYTDNGDYIARELITPHFFATTSFDKLHIYRLRLDMEQGVGDGTRLVPTQVNELLITEDDDILVTEAGYGLSAGTSVEDVPMLYNPQIMLQVSRDGGYTYGNEMWSSFGQVGQYLKRAEWRRLGVSRNYVFKFRITDPVKVVMMSAAAYAAKAEK